MFDAETTMLTWSEARGAFVRHWFKGTVVAVGALLLIAAATFALPRTYHSEAKLLVKIGRETVTLDPTVSTGQLVSIYESRENELNSLLEVLKSRKVLEGVAHRLGASAILYGGRIPTAEARAIAAQKVESDRPTRSQDAAVQKLEKSLEIWLPKKSSIVSVRGKAESPELAQAIVATLLEVFREEHTRVNRTNGSYDFFVQQFDVTKKTWSEAVDQLRQTKERMGVASIEGKRDMLQGQLTNVESRMIAVQGDLASNEAKIESLERTIAQLPETTITSRVENANGGYDQMRGSLYGLQIREQELLSKFTPDHPQVLAVRSQVEDLQSILQREQPTRQQATSSANPARQALELNLLNERAQRDSLTALATQLTKQKQEVLSALKVLHRQEVEVSELQRTAQLAETSHRDVAQKLEQARLNQALEDERISNVNVVQPASYSSKAMSPKRSLILMLAAFVSSLAGAAVPVGLAYVDRRFRSTQSVADRLRLPVSGMVPGLVS